MTTFTIILGAPRSGTTFLANVLRAHPDLAYWDEPRILWKYGNETKSDILSRSDLTPAVREYIRTRINDFAATEAKPSYLEKLPSHALRIDFVDAVLPECRFIHIVRDGYSATPSIRGKWLRNTSSINPRRLKKRFREAAWRQVPQYLPTLARRAARTVGLASRASGVFWGPELPGLRGVVDDLGVLDAAALQWKTCVELACQTGDRLPPERYTEFRLETLSEQRLEELVAFIGLCRPDAVVAEFRRLVNYERAKTTVQRLTEEEQARVARWIEPTQSWLRSRPRLAS